MLKYSSFINNKFITDHNTKKLEVLNPATGNVAAVLNKLPAKQVEIALSSSVAAQKKMEKINQY